MSTKPNKRRTAIAKAERSPVALTERAPPPGPHLLDRHEVTAIANVSYPTLWTMMRAGTFPRSRIVGGKSMWVSTEVEQWLAGLPVRPLKGDAALVNEGA